MSELDKRRFGPVRDASQTTFPSTTGPTMGKRSAVRVNSGLPVYQSGPGLGRANNSTNNQPKAGGLPANFISQPKTGRGLGQSPSGGESRRAFFT